MVRAVARYGGTPPVSYRLCLSFGKAKRRCGESQPTVPGEPSILFLPTGDSVGLATVSWRVDNTEVASYSIRFVKQPIVPPFGISPLILSGKRRLFGLIVRHLPEGLRVRAWRDCRRGCPLPLRQVYRNGETRRYRIVASKPKATFNFGDELQVLIDAPWRPEGSKLWGRLYRGKLVRDRKGGPGDTAIRRVKPALCIPPGRGKLLRIARKCNKVRSSKAPLQRITSRLGFD